MKSLPPAARRRKALLQGALALPLAFFLALLLPANEAQAQRRKPANNAGEMLAQSCFACHGSKGASLAAPIPIIGGQREAYLNGALRAFRDGSRPSTIMGSCTLGFPASMPARIPGLSFPESSPPERPGRLQQQPPQQPGPSGL